eukprot:GSChrysophyteH1.ASY1.ANO1.482.1 assembled CDS
MSLSSSVPLKRSSSAEGLGKPRVTIPKKGSTGGISVVKRDARVQKSPLEDFSSLSDFLNLSDDMRKTSVETLLSALLSADSEEKHQLAAKDIAIICSKCGLGGSEGELVTRFIIEELQELPIKDASQRDRGLGGLLVLRALQSYEALGRAVEPFVLPMLSRLLLLTGDRSQSIRETSNLAIVDLMRVCSPFSFRLVLPHLLKGVVSADWRTRIAALTALKELSPRVSRQISPFLPILIPICTECIIDSKQQVQGVAVEALTQACAVITNDDIRHLVPQLVSVIARPEESPKTIELLMETTFVQNVDSATLALIAPLLGKVMRGRQSALKRKAARIIDSMCRLVQEPQDVKPFVPMLLPYLDRAIDEVADEEVVEVCRAAREVLLNAMGEGLDCGEVASCLRTAVARILPSEATPSGQVTSIGTYISELLAHLICYHTLPNPAAIEGNDAWRSAVAMAPHSEWRDCVVPYVTALSDKLAHAIRIAALGEVPDLQTDTEEDASNLCNVEFSLAYGSKVLLSNTFLKLGRGRKYGLMGKNGVGKTTLLTNIGNGAIEAMPTHLKCVYVKHEDIRDDMGVPIVDEMLTDKELEGVNVTKEEAIAALKKINFTDQMISSPRSALSGGWKMKLIITKAMLARADILLLDEPTNHLDKASVAWLEDYLISSTQLTCLIVSHDTFFLDKIVTDVIHYEGKNLVYYRGNLTEFVKIHPEAKHYHDLTEMNSTTKSVMYAKGVNFTYPGCTVPVLTDVNVKVSLGSRVAVLGPNGAGKSTLIKMLVKETAPDCGEVWNHMNLRVAYVAQHSFHHIEQHLDKSPVDYMKWRFGNGNIHENQKYGDVTEVVSRRKNGKYLDMGHSKLVEQMDIKVAAMAAGLDVQAEFGTHSVIRRLSGGQKVKLVLAGAMWNKPHLLVLDEPTNYLDREALGALSAAIKSFAGGCIIISHNSEFTDSICTETWTVGNGSCLVEGEAVETAVKASANALAQSANSEPATGHTGIGCTNANIGIVEKLMNPKKLEPLTAKEEKKLTRLAAVAGKSLKEYIEGITFSSPEWKWL